MNLSKPMGYMEGGLVLFYVIVIGSRGGSRDTYVNG
jgi:hypothetical protein